MRFDILKDVTDVVSAPTFMLFFLLIVLIGTIVYCMVHWSKVCKTMVQVLVIKADGHGDYALAPQSGGEVSLKAPGSDTVRLWPINEMAAVSVPYPSSGFVPAFMQKTIQLVVVDEKDWEPILNRGAYNQRVASPDVIVKVRELVNRLSDPKTKEDMTAFLDSLSTASTREMIASPAVLGNLLHEKITQAVITVNKEMMDSISGIIRRIGKTITPAMLFTCAGVVLVAVLFVAIKLIALETKIESLPQTVKALQQAIETMQKTMGLR